MAKSAGEVYFTSTAKSKDLPPSMKAANELKCARPELDLLLCCARTCLDSEREAHIKMLVQEGVDWSYLADLSLRHGLTPLLYRNLNATCPEGVPKAILDRLRDYYNANARRNVFLTGYLFKILRFFEREDIPAIPLKGPALTAMAYGDLAFRQFIDLDILVRERDVLKARDLLKTKGYRPQFELSPVQAAALLRSQDELSLTAGDDQPTIELHWQIFPRCFNLPIVFEDLSERANRKESGILTLSPEDTTLVLCMHGVKHFWNQLMWICDVAELIRAQPMDWEWVLRVSEGLGSQRMLFLGLFLAKELLDTSLPGKISKRVEADLAVRRLAAQVQEYLFERAGDVPGPMENSLFHLKVRERLQDRLRYCVRFTMTTTYPDWVFLPLPDFLFPLSYVMKPLRLAAKYGPKLLRMASGGNHSHSKDRVCSGQ
jgi:hypothetical protein